MLKKFAVLFVLMAVGVTAALAQGAQTRAAVAGQKYKIKGVVVSRDDSNSFIVRDSVGVDTKVIIAPNASIKSNGFWGGDKFPAASIVRSLNIEVEGVGDSTGAVSANKIRFEKSDMRTAQAIQSATVPIEDRQSAMEQNADRMSGQIDELLAISNAAKGGAKAAQDTADAAVAGVNATNKRISDMDDYVVQSTATVNFRVNSSLLSAAAKSELDQVASAAQTMKGYLIDITGYASAEGNSKQNKLLSQRRAQAVKDYLIENYDLDRRRFQESFGFGELKAVADNNTRAGREQNRRVEIRVLANKGLNQSVEVRQNSN